ncbi:SMC family ATPase [Candidatus Micrarchaeota archaeon]|nr:SMC family ATPase [Candidatus Micrarchaeota archaeon]
MITRLVLENWRSHERSEFEFAKGTNVLIGSMGSGKTSAMDAICFALFGTFPLLQSKKIKLDDMIMNKPTQKNQARVVLEMTVGEQNYKIKRTVTLGKGANVNELWKNDTLIESPQNVRTTEKICEILKIDYDLFSRAVYAEQNNIEYFLEIPKSQRKQRIDELLRISKFENARKNLASLISRIDDRVKDATSLAESESAINDIPSIERELSQKLGKHSELKEKIAKAALEKQSAQNEYGKIYSKKQRHDELNSIAERTSGTQTSLAKRVAEYGSVTEDEATAKRKITGLTLLKNEMKTKQAEKDKLETSAKEARGGIIENEKNIREYGEKISKIFIPENAEKMKEDAERQLDAITSEIENLKAKYTYLDEQKKELFDHVKLDELERCPTCETDLTPERKTHVIETRLKKQKEIEDEQTKVKHVGKEMENEKKKAKEMLEKIRESLAKADEKKWLTDAKRKAESALIESSEVLKNAETKLKGLKIDRLIDDVIEELRKYERITEYCLAKKQLEETEKAITAATSEIKALGYDESAERAMYERLKQHETSYALLEQESAGIADLIEEKKKRLNELLDIKK